MALSLHSDIKHKDLILYATTHWESRDLSLSMLHIRMVFPQLELFKQDSLFDKNCIFSKFAHRLFIIPATSHQYTFVMPHY